ncbi:hypothetical protein [Salinicola socius]|uniref:Uncharacterized protein n=1 Tax=Salinicola socius TaxID=404433 RepID=A0A1Q8SXM1_9GAMM|nr:hypothetical protein [Salinicola socius]OLO06188.1 hypothetical protein BTW07_01460 [Salinicola socius]
MDQWLHLTPEEIATWLGLCSIALIYRHFSNSAPHATPMASASDKGAEAAVQVAAHPVNGKLQVYHLSRWFEAVLIDPANPPLRDGETVYLIRWENRQAWVSRVRSHTPTPSPSRRAQKRWQWSFD